MKRSHDPRGKARQTVTGDIRKDLSEKQLAHLGAIAIAYNNVELYIDMLFFGVTRMTGALQYEVSTRINGIAGKIEVIKKGAKLVDWKLQEQLEEALGEGVFGRLKGYRDAAIHARIIDGSTGIGVRIDRRARMYEVLLSEPALATLYRHLVELSLELNYLSTTLGIMRAYRDLAPGDPRKSSDVEATTRWTTRTQARRTVRLSLPPIPEFPTEQELRESESQWHKARQAEPTDWDKPFDQD